MFPDHAVSISDPFTDPSQRNPALRAKLRRVEEVSIVEAIEVQSDSTLIQGILAGLANHLPTLESLEVA